MTCPSQRELLARHCFYQKSWLGIESSVPRISLDLTFDGNESTKVRPRESSLFPKSSSTSNLKVPLPNKSDADLLAPPIDLSKLIRSESNLRVTSEEAISGHTKSKKKSSRRRGSHSLPTSPSLLDLYMSQSFTSLSDRRDRRANRQKPWLESTHSLRSHRDKLASRSQIFYENYLPTEIKDSGQAKLVTRKYVTNSKYGNVYEVKLNKEENRSRTPPLGTWLWEDEMRVWSHSTKSLPDHFPSDVERTTTPNWSKSCINTPRKGFKENSKPHADLFAHYHSYRLERERRRDAAIVIQKRVRGWLVRKTLERLKRKVLLEHKQTWNDFIEEYRRLVIRLQARFGYPQGHCQIDFKQLEQYMDDKLKYERAFVKFDNGSGATEKVHLHDFLRECEISTSEKKLSKAFDNVFKGGANKAEVVFMLDCSPIGGQQGFRYVVSFVKDVISSFQVNADHVRVGVVPYADKVSQAFTISQHQTKRGVLDAVDELMVLECDLSRPDLAMSRTQRMLANSRPGIQQIGILITDRKSSKRVMTSAAGQTMSEAGINMLVIGVGPSVDKEDLESMVSIPDHVFTVSSYTLLKSVKDLIVNAANLVSQKGETIAGSCRALTKEEALEICWTLCPPAAAREKTTPRSSWLKPVVEGVSYDIDDEKWAILDDNAMATTNIQACLKFVAQSKIQREGYVYLPTSDKYGVVKVTNEDEAIKVITDWIEHRKNTVIDKADKYDPLAHWLQYK